MSKRSHTVPNGLHQAGLICDLAGKIAPVSGPGVCDCRHPDAPDQPFGHLALAQALRRAPGGGLQAALDALVPVAGRTQDRELAFGAACCCSQLGHLVGLLPAEAPLFVGFQEIGGGEDLAALARAASARFRKPYEALFVPGRDSATGQNVGAILDGSRGWGVDGRPARASDLEKALSKHMVVRLTNAVAALDVCVVHLRRPMGDDGKAKQLEQNRALLRWAMRHLAKNPKSNLAVMGRAMSWSAPRATR